VLDCACGTGLVAAGLAEQGFRVSASDASPGMVAAARARGVAAEVRRWEDLEPGGFDAVLCVGNSLTHARDRRQVLARMRRALRPDGTLIVTARNWELERARGSRTEPDGAVTRTWTIPGEWDAPHLLELTVLGVHEVLTCWAFTHAALQEDLRAAGLDPVSSTYAPGAGRYLVTARARSAG
jgi:SAM-dependent methyltransferase